MSLRDDTVNAAKRLVGGKVQGHASVAISEDRKAINLYLPGGLQLGMSVEAARFIGNALLDAADELDPPKEEG